MPFRSDPHWRQLLDDTLRLQEGPDRRSIGVNLSRDEYAAVLAAAQARGGISLASYMRRSSLAVVCFDLGMDWGEVTAGEKYVRSLDLSGKPRDSGARAGQGFGPWLIDSMREYTP